MVELYIDGKKADLTTTVSVPMNYELEKLENPTIIKNNFSKTISLEATPNNNDIFSYYYDLTKIHTGIGFCANKRIPFELYRDSDLVETGYLQLNNIKYKGNKYTYEITLYGGLGDFLYNLAYDDEGNEKTLADLNYGYGENDEDFEFHINAENVYNAWTQQGEKYPLLGETINFIPSYNGLYEEFDNNKVLINTNEQTLFSESFKNDNTTYSTIGGFGMAEIEEEMTEWEIRDLRCYKQRPAIRIKDFVKAVCNPENNGGYEVELDGRNFFNDGNSYYENAWIALPLLNPDSEEWVETTTELKTDKTNDYEISIVSEDSSPTDIVFTDYTSSELVETFGGNSSIDVSVDFSLKAYTDYYNGNPDLFLSYTYQEKRKNKFFWSGIGVWLEAIHNGITIGVSDCLVFTSGFGQIGDTSYRKLPSMSDFINYKNNPITNFVMVDGRFSWDNDGNYDYTYRDWDKGNNTFNIKLKNVPNYSGIEYKLKTKRWFSENPTGMSGWVTPYMFAANGGYVPMTSTKMTGVESSANINVNSNKKSLQDAKITKQTLLKNKITPASLLLSYTKLFGLYFVKDAQRKKVKILTKNAFFENADIIDIDDKIDYSNEVKIEPLMFNKKWYTLKCPSLETTQMKTYKSDYYEAEYGQKRINTNYNFNTDEEDIYKDNQYQNIITILDSSKYYKNFYGKDKEGSLQLAPTFGLYGCKYKLWYNGDIERVGEIELGKNGIITDEKTPSGFGTLVGQDAFAKLCCFDKDNNKQSLNDLSVSLVFYNFNKSLYDLEEKPIYYTISDDLPIMETVNEGTPMYLWSNSDYDENGERICYRSNVLPQFTRYDVEANNVYKSFDFGLPYETYITENYTEDATLYNQYWQKFYQDQFSENTRKVTAYVRFEDIMLGNHSLSNFYYFNNCYWLLNKIVDYDIANPTRKVKCEFIKVNNTDNYTNGQKVIIPWYEFDVEFDALDDWEILENDTFYGGTFKARFKPYYGIKEVSMNMANTTKEEREKKISIVDEGNGFFTITVSNIVGYGSIYISGHRETEVTVHYGTNTTIPSLASTKSLQMAVGTNKNIVWTNTLDDSDTMEIKMIDANVIHFRVVPNAYGSTGRMRCGFKLNLSFDDGTTKNLTFGTATDSWFTTEFEYGKTIRNINVEAYDLTVL